MAKEPVKKMIGNYEFEFFAFPPREGLKITTRLLKLIGEPLGLVLDSANTAEGKGNIVSRLMEGNIAGDTFSRAMRSLTDRLDENEVIDTIYLLLSRTHIRAPGDHGTRALNMEVDFAGELGLLIEAAVASVEVNFGSFLRERFGKAITSLK